MADDRLQTGLWLEGRLRALEMAGTPYYIVNRGAYASGMVLLKLNGLVGECRLLIQQRDLDDVLRWESALPQDKVPEKDADDYMRRAVARDPDLWAIEIEDRRMENPFLDR